MKTYNPDKWVMLEISNSEGKFRKILASWYGGYLNGDSWRVSSSIIQTSIKNSKYEFFTESDSVYVCDKRDYGMSTYTSAIISRLVDVSKENNISIEIVDENLTF